MSLPRVGLLLALAIVLAGCGSPETVESERPAPVKTAMPLPQGTLFLRDASQSVAGYFGRNEVSWVQMFLQGEFVGLLAQEPSRRPIATASFGRRVGTETPLVGPSECWRLRMRSGPDPCYGEEETNLREVFSVTERELFAPAEKHLALRGTVVILTDMVQSILKTESATSSGCLLGYDVQCVTEPLKRLVSAGVGLWIVGVKTQFDGTVYGEVPGLQGLTRAKTFIGLRPLYFVVASRDIAPTRALVVGMKEALLRLREPFPAGMRGTLRVETVEIAPGEAPRVTVTAPVDATEGLVVDDLTCRGGDCGVHPVQCARKTATGTYALDIRIEGVDDGWRVHAEHARTDWLSGGTQTQRLATGIHRWTATLDCRGVDGIKTASITLAAAPAAEQATHWWRQWTTTDGRLPHVQTHTFHLATLLDSATAARSERMHVATVTVEVKR
ncbi:MAG: hypothetical protein FJ027_16245 [Candidatus Rokubacteria bacterium]|nr:hypothetical protein [Candidatus Rokubacteria bacterium]